ncbi:hypothetical protein MMC30_001773 [Trapelia coarctata]|nr:hypothetical protein [Trapelia coarctata]
MSSLPQTPCPSGNLTTYTSTASNAYVLYCNIDFSYSDLPSTNAPTLASCVTACDNYTPNATVANGASCIAASWGNPAYSDPNCYLKFQLKTGDVAYADRIYSARRVGYQINDAPILNGALGNLGPDPGTVLAGFTTGGGSSRTAAATSGVLSSTGTAPGTASSGSTAPSSTSSSPSPSSTTAPDSSTTDADTSSGLSTGAKVGIGVGVALAAIIFIAILTTLFLKRRKGNGDRRLSRQELPADLTTGKGVWHEMRGHEAPELKGDEYSAELDGTRVRGR